MTHESEWADYGLNDYLEYIFDIAKGYVYSPTKHLKSGAWYKAFFKWPDEKGLLIRHVRQSSELYDVYISPCLYKRKRSEKEDWLGTNVVWADFDFGLPKEHNAPAPTLRICSSTAERQHWYWKLPFFETNLATIESITKRLAYTLGADLSGWDYYQTLRPPGSKHHRKGTIPKVIELNGTKPVPIEDFAILPEPPQENIELNIDNIPDFYNVLAKYAWSESTFKRFRQTPKEDRSSMLVSVAYDCAEMGMEDAEILSVVENADTRWGKFTKRSDADRKKYLVGIVKRARIKYPNSDPVEELLPTFNFKQFLESEIKIEWLIEGLIDKQGNVIVSGPPNIGKSQFCLQFAIHMALGKDFLGFPINTPLRSAFLSMEMGRADLKYFLDQMSKDLTTGEMDKLAENLLIVPLGHAVILTKPANQQKLLNWLDRQKLDGVFCDSLGVAVGGSISSDEVINEFYDFINREVRVKRDLFFWTVHHHRKSQIGNKKPKELGDLYGSQYIGAHATAVIGMWNENSLDPIEVNCLKMRLAEHFRSFEIDRTTTLNFERHIGTDIEKPPQEKKERKKPDDDSGLSF